LSSHNSHVILLKFFQTRRRDPEELAIDGDAARRRRTLAGHLGGLEVEEMAELGPKVR
jgi:hypothetical protein